MDGNGRPLQALTSRNGLALEFHDIATRIGKAPHHAPPAGPRLVNRLEAVPGALRNVAFVRKLNRPPPEWRAGQPEEELKRFR